MYLESIASAPIRAKTADGRSVSTKVVQLVVQDRTVMHVAQACADVLNVANRLNECRVYDWTIERADTIGKLGRSDILVLVGGSELPWWPSAKNLQPLTSAIRSATAFVLSARQFFCHCAQGCCETEMWQYTLIFALPSRKKSMAHISRIPPPSTTGI